MTPVQVTDHDLKRALEQAGALTLSAMTLAVAMEDLGAIDLPPGPEARVDQAQMRALASLYLAADLESAGVLPAVETLAGLAGAGAVPINLQSSAALVEAFWKGRRDRSTAVERGAFFSRLFGEGMAGAASASGANADFEDLMLNLCEALYKLDELASNPTYGGTAQQARVRQAAQNLAGNLVQAGGGVTAFLAQEILAALKQAMAILAAPDLRASVGALDTWGAIAAIRRIARQPPIDPRPFARRGKAGMTVIAWLAEAAPMLNDPAQPLVGLDNPVIAAATDWMEASLALGETAPPAATQAPMAAPAPQPASPWAAIGV